MHPPPVLSSALVNRRRRSQALPLRIVELQRLLPAEPLLVPAFPLSLGSTVVIRNVYDNTDQTFLAAHTDRVTCMAMSTDGTMLATGQITHMGYQAQIILWDITKIGVKGEQPRVWVYRNKIRLRSG